jgi:hypothetical protein
MRILISLLGLLVLLAGWAHFSVLATLEWLALGVPWKQAFHESASEAGFDNYPESWR